MTLSIVSRRWAARSGKDKLTSQPCNTSHCQFPHESLLVQFSPLNSNRTDLKHHYGLNCVPTKIHVCVCVCVCAHRCLVMSDSLATPWPVALQVPLSMEFSRQEYRRGCHFLLQGVFPSCISCISCTGRQILCHCISRKIHIVKP